MNILCRIYAEPNICKEFPIIYPIITVGNCRIGSDLEIVNQLVGKVMMSEEVNEMDSQTQAAFLNIQRMFHFRWRDGMTSKKGKYIITSIR